MTNWKYTFFTLGILSISCVSSLNAQPFNIFQSQYPISTTQSSVTLLNIETPFRCQTDDIKNQQIVTTLPLKEKDFTLTYTDVIDPLPRYEVNGFSFDHLPLDEALQQLVEEAKIDVYTEDESYIELNAKDIYGTLETVIDELTKVGDTYYKYDASTKKLYLSHKGRFEIELPQNRLVILSVLDALRGAGIENITPNWKTGTLFATLTREEEKKVKDLLDRVVSDGRLLLADTQVYAISPITTSSNWGNVVQKFGVENIHSSNKGLMGKLILMGHQKTANHLINSIKQFYQVIPISQGMAIVPNNWKTRFEIGKCAINTYMGSSLSLLLKPHIQQNGQIDSQVTLDTTKGELSTFDVNAAIDNELAIIGIPDQITHSASELLVILRLKLIRLVGGKS